MPGSTDISADGSIVWGLPATFDWVLYRLQIDGEAGATLVTVPVPRSADTPFPAVLARLKTDVMLPLRLTALYGADFLAGRSWTVVGRDVIRERRARALFPDDPFPGGTTIGIARRPR